VLPGPGVDGGRVGRAVRDGGADICVRLLVGALVNLGYGILKSNDVAPVFRSSTACEIYQLSPLKIHTNYVEMFSDGMIGALA